jgi:hypothetical protein
MASLFLRSVRATANPAFTTLRAAKTPTLRRFLATTAEQPRLRIGSEAPNFKAKTTAGDIDFHQWLDGKWAILFSHPADFTPVCTTELGAFAKLGGEFEKRGVKMIGLVSQNERFVLSRKNLILTPPQERRRPHLALRLGLRHQ